MLTGTVESYPSTVIAPVSPTSTRSTPASSATRADGWSYAVTITIGWPLPLHLRDARERRPDALGPGIVACIARQPPITVLSIRRARPSRAASATRTGRPLKFAAGVRSSASRASRYSGSIPDLQQLVARGGQRHRHRVLAAGGDPLRRSQRAGQRRRPLALVGAQVAVPGAHREAVGLAHRGEHRDPNREVEVLDHPADHDRLLRVLLAEESDVGLHDVEQLGDDGGDALEVLRPPLLRRSVQHVRQPRDGDRGRESPRVDLLHRRHKEEIDSLGRGNARIARLVVRIRVEVLPGAELGRVDEQRHDDRVAALASRADQRQMSPVERAHRGDDADLAAAAAPFVERRAQIGLSAHRPHAVTSGSASRSPPAGSRRAASARVRSASAR